RLEQRPVVDVVAPRPAVPAVERGRELVGSQTVEEVDVHLSMADACERTVVTPHADTGVKHHGHEEAGLALREVLPGNGLDALVEGQDSISSARRTSRPRPPRPRPDAPPSRAPTAL